MPWQRMVADIFGEIDPATGKPAYRDVVVTIPRQQGKTSLALAVQVQRAIGWPEAQQIAYTAQDGGSARKKLLNDQMPKLERHTKALGIDRFLRANDNTGILFRNGSRIIVLSSSPEAGHGLTLDLGIKDEFWQDEDDRRDQAMSPAMITRPAAQMLTISTVGKHDGPTPFNTLIARGRAAVEADTRSGIAYFEWSADPDDDPDDPATWRRCMPALGFVHPDGSGITEEGIRHERETRTDENFRRAYLNIIPTTVDNRPIPPQVWGAASDPNSSAVRISSIAVDVAYGGGRSSVAVIGERSDGHLHAVVTRNAPSTDWLLAEVQSLRKDTGVPVVMDTAGHVSFVAQQFQAAGIDPTLIGVREMTAACASLVDALKRGHVFHIDQPELNSAVAGASKRSLGDAWAWSRKSSAVDISPLVAVTLAAWGAAQGASTNEPFMIVT